MKSFGKGCFCLGLMLALGGPLHAGAAADSYTISLPNAGCYLLANQLDRGNNTFNEVLTDPGGGGRHGWAMEGSVASLPPFGEPCHVYALFQSNVLVTANNTELVVGDEFAEDWEQWGGIPWTPGVGFLLFFARVNGDTNYMFQGTPRIDSPTPIDLRAGGYCLLARESAGIGTYDNIVKKAPQEGHKVVRLRPGAVPSNVFYPPLWVFAASDLLIYTFTDGAWVPEPPQLNVGEAAWFYAPPPLLQLSMVETNAVLSWPVASIDMQLQCAPQFSNPTSWTNVTTAPTTNGTVLTITIPKNPAEPQFYRLRSKL